MFKGNVLIVAKEAGAAAYFASLMEREDSRRCVVYACPKAADVFKQAHIPFFPITRRTSARDVVDSFRPKVIYIALSVGATFEKKMLLEGQKRGIPVFAFVDSFLNLWQRFASNDGEKKWYYRPDKIFVIDRKTRSRIISQGAPRNAVKILPHPLITRSSVNRGLAKMTKAQIGDELKLPANAHIILFVSEYRLRDSKIWKWDQPAVGDLGTLLKTTVRAAEILTEECGVPTFLLIKRHPVERTEIIKSLPQKQRRYCRSVGAFDKASLIQAADIVTGLTSILLSEATESKKVVFSYHHFKSDQSAWFSSVNTKIRELDSPEDCIRLVLETVLNKHNKERSRN
jgi:hypothetical protein